MTYPPVRVQRSRQRKQVSPNGLPIVYVGRGSRYGNPFKIGEAPPSRWIDIFEDSDIDKYSEKLLTREDCIYLYKKYMSLEMSEFAECNKGLNVSCWCSISEKCHGDVLLNIWNA